MTDFIFKASVVAAVFVTGYIFGAAPRPPVKVACKAYEWAEIYYLPDLRGTVDENN
jgi:hypothetical protein